MWLFKEVSRRWMANNIWGRASLPRSARGAAVLERENIAITFRVNEIESRERRGKEDRRGKMAAVSIAAELVKRHDF
jgi:hypothetical protein